MCSGSEAGSSLRLIDFVYHSTLGLRVMKKKRGTFLTKMWFRMHDALATWWTSRDQKLPTIVPSACLYPALACTQNSACL